LKNKSNRKYHLRFVVDAIPEVLRTGAQWRNLNHRVIPWQSAYYYFRRWKADGTLERPSAALNQWEWERRGKPATPNLLCIDSQSVRAAALVGRETRIDGSKLINRARSTSSWAPWGWPGRGDATRPKSPTGQIGAKCNAQDITNKSKAWQYNLPMGVSMSSGGENRFSIPNVRVFPGIGRLITNFL
jgi:transposase